MTGLPGDDMATPVGGKVLPGPWTARVVPDRRAPDRGVVGPPAAELADGATSAGVVLEGDVLGSAGVELYRPRALVVSRAAVSRTWVVVTGVRAVASHPQTKAGAKLVARNLWYPVAGAGVACGRWRDSHGASRYERQMRRAEIAGDQESLREWEARDVAEKARRHARVMDWVRSPVDLLRAVAAGLAGFAALLLALGVVLALGHHDPGYVLAPLVGVIGLVTFVCWFLAVYGAALLLVATGGAAAWLWHLGRSRSELPAWVSAPPAGDAGAGRDVVPDERAITNALRNLNMPALNRKFREGWTPRWIDPPVHDGKGWHSRLLLPEGVTVEMIVNSKPVLAHNLLRLPVEVWPTEPRDAPGVLDLWVADQGSLTKPVAPWPLLTTGVADYFKGVPVGVDPRGNVVLGRLFQANWGVAGMMGSGKSTLIITGLLGAILDPLVEIDVYCMAVNADYDPLRPRLRTLFVSDDPDEIPTVLAALKQLMSELSDRGRKLSAAGEPKLTRALAEADPGMRPRVVVIDECQELFVSDVGDEAAELVEKIVAKARKYGVTLIFATPVPSADSLPRKVAKVLSNRACFAIADHQGNDAILGTGKHRAGISATTLRPMTVAADGAVDLGDLGTAMASGFTPTDGLLRCFYVRRGDGVDDVTPVVERAMAMLDTPPAVAPADEAEPAEHVDYLADIRTVIRAAGGLDPIMRTQEVLAGLAALRPQLYRGWTFERLRKELPDSARPYKTRGQMCVNADRVTAGSFVPTQQSFFGGRRASRSR
ncbi:zonular occludens toxin domain-containing protein [Candidatus Frankia alpina]|uniref:Cell division protein FtsK n=1 Tax=Candidatus Frankia alpina TaxID=2699483 RepID=A0A4S5ERQ6_9ACTN|nr:zonular occludens toxin domain-containing protein [Candidatus Frankia alpina]THJ74710.1 cell division protein FtsK [Candidatus Frankia alpina]